MNDNKWNVLLVDHDQNNIDDMTSLLIAQGLNPLVAHDVEQAMEIIRDHNINIIVTVAIMPGVTGLELSRNLEAKYPIVLITGNEDTKVIPFDSTIKAWCSCVLAREDIQRLPDACFKALERHEWDGALNKMIS
tara:strand:+ start:35978 stop:36379 length:402 start_codon:yes stop_codon:yes gene_type:complete